MNSIKVSFLSLVAVGLSFSFSSCSSGQSSNSENLNSNREVENYQETINTNKRLEELSKKAENFSYTEFTDSTLKYNEQLRSLAEDYMRANDSIAEEYIRSTYWNYLSADLYPYALEAGKRVYDMRKNRYGKASEECWDWMKTLQAQAFKNHDLENLAKFSDEACQITIENYGYDSPRLEEQFTEIGTYANSLIETAPEFTVTWIQPYFQIMCNRNITPDLRKQYEFIINNKRPAKKK